MAYDEGLADRIRELIGAEADLTEQKMFGGLAFLINGHIAIASSGRGGLMVRVGPAEQDALITQGKAEPIEMRGRAVTGFVRVPDEQVKTKRQLAAWVKRGVAQARLVPPKAKPKRAKRRS